MDNENIVEQHSSIDWQLSIKLANNNKELAKDLLGMFISDLPRASGVIHSAFNQKKYAELSNEVHRLHGASCYCGVSRLKLLLSKMEYSAREKLYNQFEDLLTEFDDEVNAILASYKTIEFE